MTLPELSIKRHVLAWMLSAVLVLFGLISYGRIGMDRYPYIEFPVVSITTALKGANPDIVDASITNIIESSVNSTPGIEHIQSTSSPGVSVVAITFGLEKKIDVAFNEVQAKVNQILRRLPKDVDPPVVAKVETNAQPIMWLALQGDRTQQQLNQYAINTLKKRLETIDGVGEVRLGGRRDRTIRVELLPAKMAAMSITAQDINDAFAKEHVQMAGGFVVSEKTENLIKLDLEFHSIDALKQMVIAWKGAAPIRLQDVAEVIDGLTDNRQLARFNGDTTVGLGIVKVTNTNTVAIVEKIKAKLEKELRPQLPPGLQLHVVSNDAVFILEIVNALKEHLLEAILLVLAIIFFFLRNLRATLIPLVTIPVSLIGAFGIMFALGFTINTLTLLSLVLAIGLVVDDAIVVLENIFRHREELDADPISAAVNGANEVVFAVIAATLALVSIFAPVIFMNGIIGQFFRSFAVVVTFGVLVSLFVSLTLTPMLCSRFLTVREKGHHHSRLHAVIENSFNRLDAFYRRLLAWALGLGLLLWAGSRATPRAGTAYDSASRQFTVPGSALPLLTIVAIFFLLFILFRSVKLAALIILVLPFASIGGLVGLFVSGEYVSVPASVGFIALWGIAVLNGVVLVTCIRRLREDGMAVAEAVREGCVQRFRPVMMTATVAMLGLIPFLFSSGPGSEVQRPLAIVVIGGLITSTLLTLVVLPTIYRWFDDEGVEA